MDIGRWSAVFIRLKPVLQFIFLFVSEAWLYWLLITRRKILGEQKDNNQAAIAGLAAGVIILSLILVIAITGMGIGAGTQFWGKAGVPILHWQIWIAAGVAVLWLLAQKGDWKVTAAFTSDFMILGLLWILSFAIWQSIPLAASRYSTNLYPPNYVSYPYSDAGDYAIQAEAILAGKGFPYGFIDKPLHLVFLSFLGLMAGKDFALQTQLQVGFLAIIPCLVFLLASKMYSRSAGIFAGLIVLFMQANNLALTNRIQMTNVKMTMSESLTCLMLLLVALSLCSWWKNPGSTWGYPALAGAILGLSSLVRLNVLVMIPFVLLAWLVSAGFKDRTAWRSALIFLVFCILPLVPWSIRTQIVLHNPIEFVKSKTEGVLLRQRYDPIVNKSTEPANKPANQPSNGGPETSGSSGIKDLIVPMLQSGFHNLVSVALVLPASTTHTGLDETVRLPYWDQEWKGDFSQGGLIVLLFSLAMVVFGFAVGWKKNQIISLIPFLILIPYLMANTVSLVSGGRYIVPVDWVLPLYYALGMTAIIGWLMKSHFPAVRRTRSKTAIMTKSGSGHTDLWISLGLVFAVSLIPMALSLAIPNRYPSIDSGQLISEIKSFNLDLPSSLSVDELEKSTASNGALVKYGRAMFPRWMKTGESDTGGSGSAFSALPFDHLSFSILTDTRYPIDVVLPINQVIDYFPNASEVIIAGCQNTAYFDAALVILKIPKPIVYIRPDITQLSCPLPLP